MTRPRAADDFAVIRERIEELRRERIQAPVGPEARPLPMRPDHTASGEFGAPGRQRLMRAIRQKFHQ